LPASLLLTESLADSLAEAVEAGVPIETACAAANIAPRQFYTWLRAAESGTWLHGDPVSPASLETITAFAQKIRRAEARWESRRVQNITTAAEERNEKTGLRDWRADAFLLTNHPRTRKRWGQHVEVEQSGTVHHEHQLARQLEPDVLDQTYNVLEALPQPDA